MSKDDSGTPGFIQLKDLVITLKPSLDSSGRLYGPLVDQINIRGGLICQQ
jgi:hypothetical protein